VRGPSDPVHFFDALDVSRAEMPLIGGDTRSMFGMHLKVKMQDAKGWHEPQRLPTVWMEPSVAVALIQALYSALEMKFPDEIARVVAAGPPQAHGPSN
jgi:ABC-type Zn uptake system ZnuABC Zn-binding protein ZnuA